MGKMTLREVEDTDQSSEGLAMLARRLGYRSRMGQLVMRNGATASDLFEFLDDNPGACEAVIDWVLEEGPRHGLVEDDGGTAWHPSPEECAKAGDHFQSCDDDGYCNACGSQDDPKAVAEECGECGSSVPKDSPSLLHGAHGDGCSLNPKNTVG